MTNASHWGKAGLVFMKDCDIDIVEAANHVVSGFEAMGHRITGVHILSDDRAQVSTDSHDLRLEVFEDVRPAAASERAQIVLSLTLVGNGARRISRFARDALLARSLQALNEVLSPDYIQWKDTGSLLPSDSFASATTGGTAQKALAQPRVEATAAPRKTLPDVEHTNEILQDRISNQDPAIFDAQSSPERLRKIFSEGWVDPAAIAAQEAAEAHAREMEDIEEKAPLRLSAWFMSFAVVLIALPIGVALLIVNMAKGENLRLSSQTAALTGTFVAFQSMGTTANAMEAIQRLIQ